MILKIRIEKPEKSPIVPPIRPSCATIVTFESMLEMNNLKRIDNCWKILI